MQFTPKVRREIQDSVEQWAEDILFGRQTQMDAPGVAQAIRVLKQDTASNLPPHLAAMANENGDVKFTCPRCDWFAQVPADPQGVFLHQLSDARMGHVAIAHPDLWTKWNAERD